MNRRLGLLLIFAVASANALPSGTSLDHQLTKRSPQPCSYPPCPAPMPDPAPMPNPDPMPMPNPDPMPMPNPDPMPMPNPDPMPMPNPDPMPMPNPTPDCTCPSNAVLPSISKLIANLSGPLGKTLLGLLGDNNLINALNALIAQLFTDLTGCPAIAAMGAGEPGVAGLVNGLVSR